MGIREYLDNHAWRITTYNEEHEQTHENHIPDIDNWLYDEKDYLIEQFSDEIEENHWGFFDSCPEFRKKCGEDYEVDKDQWKFQGDGAIHFDDWYDENFKDELYEFLCNQDIREFYYDNELFNQTAKEIFEDQYDEEYAGILNFWDVAEACDEATYEAELAGFIEEQKDEYKDEFKRYIRERYEEYWGEYQKDPDAMPLFWRWLKLYYTNDFDEWVEEEKLQELKEQFTDERIGDDYAPIWLTAWEFPGYFDVEYLNEQYRYSGLVFFKIWKNCVSKTFVSLTGCGMDMSPIIYHAFIMEAGFTDEEDIREMLYKIQSSGLSYCKSVIGEERFHELLKKIGEERIDKANGIGRRKNKEFINTLNALTKARDEGEMDQLETGLLAMMAYGSSQQSEVENI